LFAGLLFQFRWFVVASYWLLLLFSLLLLPVCQLFALPAAVLLAAAAAVCCRCCFVFSVSVSRCRFGRLSLASVACCHLLALLAGFVVIVG
jgi:hypothetical protein